ncbi:hypothetical protein CWO85_00760 [Candidatus Phytoplasma ziziphi]|uniref:Uncharacterized protein n=1 Tax=Ziziphus jujuba witches'-broom phytoplasma TaxID=135727 RepID=A0A660HLZ9_ZIZJU|nr:hypothetical protein [Candidatus Phytoplasma ziziphi]AYJ01071.1 hypothetical protein CWO85_00760 [Candidatus Phytoplasma ziziphi]
MLNPLSIHNILGSIIGVLVFAIISRLIILMKNKKEKTSLSAFQDNKKKIKNHNSEIIKKKEEIQILIKNITSLNEANKDIKTKILEEFNNRDNQDIKEIVTKYAKITNTSKPQENKGNIESKDNIAKAQIESKKDLTNKGSLIEKIQEAQKKA